MRQQTTRSDQAKASAAAAAPVLHKGLQDQRPPWRILPAGCPPPHWSARCSEAAAGAPGAAAGIDGRAVAGVQGSRQGAAQLLVKELRGRSVEATPQ